MIEKIKIGEIIQADVTRFIIACSHREQAKEKDLLGCLVKTESQHHTLYSVIANIEYIPTDSSRSVLPLGLSRHKLNQEMNHLYELIHIKYTTVAVGYSNSLSNSSESSFFVRMILNRPNDPVGDELLVVFNSSLTNLTNSPNNMKTIEPELYTSEGFTIDELVRIYKKYIDDLNDPREIWIDGYDEFLFYRSDIEIRKKELTHEQRLIVLWCDNVVLREAYSYFMEYEFGLGLLDDWYRDTHYPKHHWWWYVDKIFLNEMEKPTLNEDSLM
ncbi:hypothetical protein CHS0354_000577 [Potamilus streckersoni]|uniref:Uncharacterized protein n=1 Tax=Potamilus streckersoni TaxID=2493646 RepID=A0AAE0T6Z1_9BIVA|nr:hypothetical protein CHS0354_000577 [Potamilus streckersoni]